MKTLLVRNTLDEYSVAETEQIIRFLHADFMFNATTIEFVTRITQVDYDVLWYVGHSNEIGLVFRDGEIRLDNLWSLLSTFDLIVLNSCSSLSLWSGFVFGQSDTTVVTTARQIESGAGFVFGINFAKILSELSDIQLAVDTIDNDDEYIVLRGNLMASKEIDELTKAVYALKNEMNLINHRLQAMENLKPMYVYLNLYLSVILTVTIAYLVWSM